MESRFQHSKHTLGALVREPKSWIALARALRYRVDRNALRFAKNVFKSLPTPEYANRRLVLFAHFDPDDYVDPYVIHYLNALKKTGADIVFVSGSPWLSPRSAKLLEKLCEAVVTQPTLSLDFGSWNLGWQLLKQARWELERYDQLILANDSVYGPLFPLEGLLENEKDADLFGVTENLQHSRHLQSYFLGFQLRPRTIHFLNSFWRDFRYQIAKANVIHDYEIGISERAIAEGLNVGASIPYASVKRAMETEPAHPNQSLMLNRDLNSSILAWDVLISRLHCPFLKTAIAKDPFSNRRIQPDIENFVAQHTAYPSHLIREHVQRLMNRAA